MVIVDTSIWIDFLRARDGRLSEWMATEQVLQHPYVTQEISMGSFRSIDDRYQFIDLLESLPQLPVAQSDEFHSFVSEQTLFGVGIGFADAHLLFAGYGAPDVQLATGDKRLGQQAARLGIALI